MMKKRVRQNTTLESGKKTMAANSATVSCGRRRAEAVLFGCVFCLKTPWLVGSICHQNNFLWPKKNLSKYNFHHYCALRFSFIDWVKVNMQEEESQCTAVWGGQPHKRRLDCAHTEPPHPSPPTPFSRLHFSRPRSDCDLSQFPLWSRVWCTLLGDFNCRTS